jgi:hypothetical protein
MLPAGGRRDAAILFCIPALIVVLGCGASLLPPATVSMVLDVLMAWTCLSVPLAVLVGHCILTGE